MDYGGCHGAGDVVMSDGKGRVMNGDRDERILTMLGKLDERTEDLRKTLVSHGELLAKLNEHGCVSGSQTKLVVKDHESRLKKLEGLVLKAAGIGLLVAGGSISVKELLEHFLKG